MVSGPSEEFSAILALSLWDLTGRHGKYIAWESVVQRVPFPLCDRVVMWQTTSEKCYFVLYGFTQISWQMSAQGKTSLKGPSKECYPQRAGAGATTVILENMDRCS